MNRQQTLRQVLADPETYATTLLAMVADLYGTELFQWHPTTIRLQLSQDIGPVDKQALDKLMAGISLVTSNEFYRRLPYFVQVCNILSGDDFDPTLFDPADVMECAWGVTEATLISPVEDGERPDDEIVAYVRQMLDIEGYVRVPAILRRFAGVGDAQSLDYADDPEMFQALVETQTAKAQEVDDIVHESLSDLLGQLTALPLRTGDASSVIENLKSRLGVGAAA